MSGRKSIIHFFSPQSGSNSNIGGASETVIKNVEKRFVCQYCEVKVSHLGALKLHEHWKCSGRLAPVLNTVYQEHLVVLFI